MQTRTQQTEQTPDQQTAARSAQVRARELSHAPADAVRRVTSSERRPVDVLSLNRALGNRVVQRLLAQRQIEEEEELQMKPLAQRESGAEGYHLDSQTAGRINRARGGGQPLDRTLSEQMSLSMGYDFSGVRVHADSEAHDLNQQLNARAFTTGHDIFFRQGEYRSGSSGGRELIGHELAHVVQQATGRLRAGGSGMTMRPAGDHLETQAGAVARRATMARTVLAPTRQRREEKTQVDARARGHAHVRPGETVSLATRRPGRGAGSPAARRSAGQRAVVPAQESSVLRDAIGASVEKAAHNSPVTGKASHAGLAPMSEPHVREDTAISHHFDNNHGVLQRALTERTDTAAFGWSTSPEGDAFWVYGDRNHVTQPKGTLTSSSYGSCVGLVVHDVVSSRGLVAHFWNPAGEVEAAEILGAWRARTGNPPTSLAVVFGGSVLNSRESADQALASAFTRPRMKRIAALARVYMQTVVVEEGHREVRLRLGAEGQPTWE